MYRINQKYKIELRSKIIYTAKIIAEDDISIKIKTIRNEELVINKENINQAILIYSDGDNNE